MITSIQNKKVKTKCFHSFSNNMGDTIEINNDGKYIEGLKERLKEGDVVVFLANGKEIGRAEVSGYTDCIQFKLTGDVEQPIYTDKKGKKNQRVIFEFDKDNVETALLTRSSRSN